MTNEQVYRQALEQCYAHWSRDQKDCCETADIMANIIHEALEIAEPAVEPTRDAAMGVSLPITEHRYSQGEPGVWKWDQSCRCRRCYEEYERVVAEQSRALNRSGDV